MCSYKGGFADAKEFKKNFENAQIINAGGTPPEDEVEVKQEDKGEGVVEQKAEETPEDAGKTKEMELAAEEKKEE